MTINLPNTITLLRILLVPLFIILLQAHLFIHALMVFVVAGISDGLDGFFARFLNQKTPLGALLDPIADKLLLISAYISLGIMGILPHWLAVLVISRDIIILSGVLLLLISNIKLEIAPRLDGKFTTAFQLLTISCVLFNKEVYHPFVAAGLIYLYIITALLTIVSGLHYIYVGLDIQQTESTKRPNNRKDK